MTRFGFRNRNLRFQRWNLSTEPVPYSMIIKLLYMGLHICFLNKFFRYNIATAKKRHDEEYIDYQWDLRFLKQMMILFIQLVTIVYWKLFHILTFSLKILFSSSHIEYLRKYPTRRTTNPDIYDIPDWCRSWRIYYFSATRHLIKPEMYGSILV